MSLEINVKNIVNNFEEVSSDEFLEILNQIMLEFKSNLTVEYLKGKIQKIELIELIQRIIRTKSITKNLLFELLDGDILNNKDDKKFSLTGLAIRLTDKISRLKNLLVNGKNYVKGEGMEDTFIDIANYGIIGLLVGRDKWKK